VIDVQIPGYRVLRTLGAGGMATVYLAEQQSLEREVALKVMAPALAANAEFCQQFLKEGRITAKLSHPNLVTVHDIGSYEGTYYMASEYLPAGSLRERLQKRLSIDEALTIARDVAAGLNYAHDMGFVHRDVKPGNILFRASGSAVLADFGIAKAMKSISSATMAGNAIGTPDYMSPEQAQASLVDGRTDIYSLGAVLFEMLAGRKPYVANDPYVVALRHVTEPVPQLPESLAWLQPLIDRAMAKDREQRFASAAEFIAECDAIARVHPEIAVRRVEPKAASGGRAGDLRRWQVPVLATLLVIALGTLAWRWSGSAGAPAKPAPTQPASLPEPPPPERPPEGTTSLSPGLEQLATPALLARAGKYLDEGVASDDGRHLSFPDGDNAIDLFREALRREPGNAVASRGLERIAAFYAQGARSAAERGLDTVADELVDKGLRATPDAPSLLQLKKDIAARASAQSD
jgi:hypothetical protein